MEEIENKWRALSIELESLIGYDATTNVLCRIIRGKTKPASNLISLEKIMSELR